MSPGSAVTIRIFDRFGDPALEPVQWNRLLRATRTRHVFLTREWQSCWWQAYGRGRLLLIGAYRDGRLVALAPLFADCGTVYFIGSGGSDYLGFLGDLEDPGLLAAILGEARAQAPGFLGFLFYHVPEGSGIGRPLESAAALLGLRLCEQGGMSAPLLDIAADPEFAAKASRKEQAIRYEKALRRAGPLEIRHLRDAAEIEPLLEAFFGQHIERWSGTPTPSLFLEQSHRRFYRALCAAGAGWLRFSLMEWNGRPVAFHLGFQFEGSFLFYKPCYDLCASRFSPGIVLLRHLLVHALEQGARIFDLGLGEETYKGRFANRAARVQNWGLYPAGTEAILRQRDA